MLVALWFWLSNFFEQPDYNVIKRSGSLEIRVYPRMMVARAKSEGKRDIALRRSFPYLINYISGKQRVGPKISMTVPVMQAKAKEENSWSVYFIMSREYSYESLPKPQNNHIEIL